MTAETPVLALFREWQALHDRIARDGEGMSDAELDAETDAQIALEHRMLDLPSTCAADFAAKMVAYSGDGFSLTEGSAPALWAEARALLGASAPA